MGPTRTFYLHKREAKRRDLSSVALPTAPIGVPTGVPGSCGALPYPSARAATSSRQKAGMSGTTRPHTRRGALEERWDTASRALSGGPERASLPGWCERWCDQRGPRGGGRQRVVRVRYLRSPSDLPQGAPTAKRGPVASSPLPRSSNRPPRCLGLSRLAAWRRRLLRSF